MGRKRTVGLSVTAAVALVVAGGVAYGAIPAADGTITACYAKSGGAMRVIDVKKGQACTTSEKVLTLNQQGPIGPSGADGAAGAQGQTGPAGPTGPQGVPGAGALFQGDFVVAPPAPLYYYKAGDLVRYQTKVWIATAEVPCAKWQLGGGCLQEAAPGSVDANGAWKVFAQDGATGATGARGATGATGPIGPQGPAGLSGLQTVESPVQTVLAAPYPDTTMIKAQAVVCPGTMRAIAGGFRDTDHDLDWNMTPVVSSGFAVIANHPYLDNGWVVEVENLNSAMTVHFKTYAVCANVG